MIEMMFSLLIMLVIIQLVPLLLKTLLLYNSTMTSIADIELAFFLKDLITDYNDTKDVTVLTDNAIKFHKDNTTYHYKFKNNKIIKAVNNKGNITMLNNVTKFKVTTLINKNIMINITVQDQGETIEKTLHL
ncbi:competence type IV pilus minor pilin ComGF [Staphylococcus durrellii]|uniref:competence type IV pilus minor pilin ComGF n=1 Tax=Staphylococcus durrellii TaxID=2781773 RepID=UPI0038B573AA